jgi:hypothetical protein
MAPDSPNGPASVEKHIHKHNRRDRGETNPQINPLKPNLVCIAFNNSVRTAMKTFHHYKHQSVDAV